MATQASIETIQEFYVTYLSRAADPGGLEYWANKLSETDDLTEIVTEFGNAFAFIDVYSQMSNRQLINSLYQQMFNRSADAEGLAFYTDRLETGVATLEDIAKQIIDGIKGSGDSLVFNNKMIQANCLTDEISLGGGPDYIDHDAILDSVGLETPECLPFITHQEISIAGITGGEGDMFA